MPGFDWNGNGKSDAFDHFMDMKVISDVVIIMTAVILMLPISIPMIMMQMFLNIPIAQMIWI